MKIDLKRPEMRFVLELVRLSARLACRVSSALDIKSITKQDRSPVTIADMGIQAMAGALLEKYLPGAVLVAEEDANYLKSPGGAEDLARVTSLVRSFFPDAGPGEVCRWIERGSGEPSGSFWTLDPIDGTKGFLRGGQYATALAYIQNGQLELGAIGCPELELEDHRELGKGVGILAFRGQGCRAFSLEAEDDPFNWVSLKVSSCRDITQARILDSFDPHHKDPQKNQKVREALGTLMEPSALDSMAKHVVIASGGAEIFFRTLPQNDPGHREKIWDVAAGALAIEEAGGRVTDLEGRKLDFGAGLTLARNPGFVATNGFLHEDVLAALQGAGRP